MIAINQDVTPQGTPVTAGDPRVWARKLSDGSTAFALINLEDDNMTIPTAALKSPCKAGPALVRAAGGCRVHELWANASYTAQTLPPSFELSPHETLLFRVYPAAAAAAEQ